MIEHHRNFRDESALKIFMAMIYHVATHGSTHLAIECANLFKPSLWKGKQINFDSFVLAKFYLLTLGKESWEHVEKMVQVQLEGIRHG